MTLGILRLTVVARAVGISALLGRAVREPAWAAPGFVAGVLTVQETFWATFAVLNAS